jgi:hypothetical protein
MEPEVQLEKPIVREIIVLDYSDENNVSYQEVHTNPEEL